MMMVLVSLTLAARLAISTEREANNTIRMMFWAMPERVVSGFRRKVIPSTMRKKAMMMRLRMMRSTLFEMPSTFLMVLSKSSFLDMVFL